MIKCSKCGIELILGENWTKHRMKTNNYLCTKCRNQQVTTWRRKRGIKPVRDITIRKGGKKLCSHCDIWRNESEFPFSKRSKDGLNCWCKECQKEYRETHKEQAKKYKQSFSSKYATYQHSAKKHNRKFELSVIDFGYLVSTPCYYCGKIQSNLNGVDRVDNSKGYVKGNCVSCCESCNRAKLKESETQFNEDTSRRFIYTLTKPFQTMPPIDISKILC